jgi:hypothetical protein
MELTAGHPFSLIITIIPGAVMASYAMLSEKYILSGTETIFRGRSNPMAGLLIVNKRIKMYKYAKIFKRCWRKGGARHAREKAGNLKERTQWKESDKSQAGNRHWSVGSQKTGQ